MLLHVLRFLLVLVLGRLPQLIQLLFMHVLLFLQLLRLLFVNVLLLHWLLPPWLLLLLLL